MTPDDTPPMSTTAGERYRFGNVVVDAAAHTLSRDGQVQAVEPKVFAALLVLLRHAGQSIPRDDLLDAVWGHRHVTPGVLTRAIAQLREALGDDAQHPRYIQTQHAVGYRFVGDLIAEPEAGTGHDNAPLAGAAGSPASSALPAQAPMPYAGHERRNPQRLWRWSWPALIVLGVALGTVIWLDQWSESRQLALPAEPSIAVLPFTTLSDDRKDAYYAEGLATEMHSALSSVAGIKVAAWLPPEAVDRKLDMRALGHKLGVATVLDATVRRDGQRFRINARLSDTKQGLTLWSRTYEREENAIFDTQGEIASQVAKALVGALPDAGVGLRKRLTPTRNVAAFDAYLRGLWQLMRPRGEADDKAAVASFSNALKQDAGFARAQAGICRAEVWRYEANREAAALNRANQACAQAKAMDARSGAVQLALGDLHRAQGDAELALADYRMAEQDPAERPMALARQGRVYMTSGREALAMQQFQKALQLAPAEPRVYADMGYVQYLTGAVPQALASYAKAADLQPGNARYWQDYGSVLMVVGRNTEAMRAFEKSIAIQPLDAALSNLAGLKYQAGDYAAAVALNRQAIALKPDYADIWVNLADVLMEVPGGKAEAHEAYAKAAGLFESYLDAKADDAMALSQLARCRAMLGEVAAALDMIHRSESLPLERAESSLYNAETLAVIGDTAAARASLQAARKAGMTERRIVSSRLLQRAGMVPVTGKR